MTDHRPEVRVVSALGLAGVVPLVDRHRGLMWNCVVAGMAQTKQVARVGRRA
jgi:hypothetical protein